MNADSLASDLCPSQSDLAGDIQAFHERTKEAPMSWAAIEGAMKSSGLAWHEGRDACHVKITDDRTRGREAFRHKAPVDSRPVMRAMGLVFQSSSGRCKRPSAGAGVVDCVGPFITA